MVHFALNFHDIASWHVQVDYSIEVARMLERAYQFLARGRQAATAYEYAFAAVAPYLNERMCAPQRIRVWYVAASACAGSGEFRSAREWLDQAVDLAGRTRAWEDTLDLLPLRSGVLRALLCLAPAATDCRTSLDLARQLAQDQPGRWQYANFTAFELTTLTSLAGFEFYLARYESCERLLDEARDLLGQRMTALAPQPDSPRELPAASLAWLEALVWRWRGQPERALRLASETARIYLGQGPAISAAFAEMLVSEVALDLASQLHTGSDHDALAELARPHVASARALAHEARDEAARSLAQLIQVRLDREMGKATDRMRQLDQVIQTAEHLDDAALLAHAFTDLGDELTFTGRTEDACQMYAGVVEALEGTEVPALQVWARRALHHLKEGEETNTMLGS